MPKIKGGISDNITKAEAIIKAATIMAKANRLLACSCLAINLSRASCISGLLHRKSAYYGIY